jgi:Cu/Zn superoxide dismutase
MMSAITKNTYKSNIYRVLEEPCSECRIGFHIHEKGDCSDDKGMNTGGHFIPASTSMAAPTTR